jgi:hypothetical protein
MFRRIVVVIACCLLSGIGIVWSLGFGWVLILGREPRFTEAPFHVVLGIAIHVAWLALFVMSVGWIRQKPVHRFWPIAGTLAGLYSLAMLPVGLFFAFPCILLAVHMVRQRWLHDRYDKPQPALDRPMPD